jgi:hypothetical protein
MEITMSFWFENGIPKEKGPFSHINTETTYIHTNNQVAVSIDSDGAFINVDEYAEGNEYINWFGGLASECGLAIKG